ncbi:SDR family oxidoreductase [Frankia sp. AgPm24]|uniref:SDR family oxidoreductase n=1 Tax=Frankia umida TaxID=573489 RepID=A0ABT0K4C4_9ACTN|nr:MULTISPECIES: SDR family oxidoreductase [Frankia]MCK9878178.1 SDR family oxidoreductase [Frankia umida]MCK9923437.1 SDR family oxidoreductase [Frankia sp. AgPm24]
MSRDVVVITGTGGMGLAIARRLASGRTLLLADRNESALHALAQDLRGQGHQVVTRTIDVTDRASMAALAATATDLGRPTHLVHTAGVSPTQGDPATILRVDLYGVALFLDEFEPVVGPGAAGLVVASTGGHLIAALPPAHQRAVATTPSDDLLDLDVLAPAAMRDSARAYAVAKQATLIRVRAAALAWGRRGARLNTISPGVILTPMGAAELAGTWGASMAALTEAAPAGRVGTPDDVADAALFLLSDQARFVTGTDLLVDGGSVALAQAQAG